MGSQQKIKFSEYKMAYYEWSLSDDEIGEVLADINAARSKPKGRKTNVVSPVKTGSKMINP